jgi:hypothetical protein
MQGARWANRLVRRSFNTPHTHPQADRLPDPFERYLCRNWKRMSCQHRCSEGTGNTAVMQAQRAVVDLRPV